MAKRRETKRILVIEDEADVLTFASRVLKLEGYPVLQAEDGDEGLRLAREKECALVLLDLRLPTIDGWDVLEQLKNEAELSAIPVVVFTASAAASERERAFSMGAVDYLVKPLSAADLRASIARALALLKE
jgi:CheY-like chemotaxis protein